MVVFASQVALANKERGTNHAEWMAWAIGQPPDLPNALFPAAP